VLEEVYATVRSGRSGSDQHSARVARGSLNPVSSTSAR
jgi:hypothetical protein